MNFKSSKERSLLYELQKNNKKHIRYIKFTMNYKTCTICHKIFELNVSNFRQNKYTNKNNVVTYYWSPYCKKCSNNKTHEWCQNNKDKCRKNEKIYRQNHIDKVKQKRSVYNKNNKTKILLYSKQYRINNKIKQQKQGRLRWKNDTAFRLRKLISRNIQKAISKNGQSITKYIPYSFNELKNHIEQQFEFWMRWNNHGSYHTATWNDNDSTTWTWQIDHIIPQSDLPYTSMTDENFKKCWALENLRPYSSKQNIIDGALRARHQ